MREIIFRKMEEDKFMKYILYTIGSMGGILTVLVLIDIVRRPETEFIAVLMLLWFGSLSLWALDVLSYKVKFTGKDIQITRLLFYKRTFEIWHLGKKVQRKSIPRLTSNAYVFKYNKNASFKKIKISYVGKKFEDYIRKIGFSVTDAKVQ